MKTKLQELRKKAGYKSAFAYADHLEIGRSSYTDYEQGRTPLPLDKAWLIADDLGVSLDELVGRTPPAPHPCAEMDEDKRRLAREMAYAILGLTEGADDEH